MHAPVVVRRFSSWRGCAVATPICAVIAALAGDARATVVMGACTGVFAALTLLLFFRERAHPRAIWSPPDAVTGAAKRYAGPVNVVLFCAVIANAIGVFGNFSWRHVPEIPVIVLTLLTLALMRLQPIQQKEPICTP